jgi:hypothetical protein
MSGRLLRLVLSSAAAGGLALSMLSCGPTLRGSGTVVSTDLPAASFSRIEVSSSFDVAVTIGEPAAVTIRVDDNVESYLDARVEGDTLHLGLRSEASISDATLSAAVTTPSLESVRSSGASRIHLAGPVAGDGLELDLSGASTLDGRVDLESLSATVSGASRVTLSGTAARLAATASGASRFELAALEVDDLRIDVSGASSAEVSVSRTLSAGASGASSLTYHGSPTLTRRDVSGGSSIMQAG